MSRAARLRRLEAMGIPVWVRRDTGPSASAAPLDESQPVDAERQPGTGQHAGGEPLAGGGDHSGRGRQPDAEQRPDLGQQPAPPGPGGSPAWTGLAEEVRTCTLCGLHATRTQTVFGVGRLDADLLVIGEAPGADEDRQGEPFVGRAGQLLNAMLQAIGLARGEVYIANILKCRPPRNRDPKPDEQALCTPYLDRQIALIRPRAILALGRIAAQWLLQSDQSMGRLRGRVLRYGESQIPIVVTYHPAYLLRTPLAKAKSWQDLVLIKKLISGDP